MSRWDSKTQTRCASACDRETTEKKFEARTNITRFWVGAHRIVPSTAADMAYEYGTLEMSYDSKEDGKRHTFQAVMLQVYKAKDGTCSLVAETMEPLEGNEH